MDTENLNVEELEKIKASLVDRVCKLRDELKLTETNLARNCSVSTENFSHFLNDPITAGESTIAEKMSSRLCDASQTALGIQFKDVEKNWCHDNVYRYEAHVITKAIQFMLELTVNLKDVGGDEVQDINCHFVNVDQSYLQEITPWVQRFTKEKHFSYLMSALSSYNEQCVIRAKILGSLKSRGYVTLEKCEEDGGGILIFIHLPKNPDKIFFKFQWFTKFFDKTWRVEHIFAIDPIEADEDFVKANQNLLQSFCKIGLRKKDLEELWEKMCHIIDNNEE